MGSALLARLSRSVDVGDRISPSDEVFPPPAAALVLRVRGIRWLLVDRERRSVCRSGAEGLRVG
jgi:hypothetical protein